MSDFANSIRPKEISDIVGQKHITNLLSKLIEKKHITSLILYGKPGIGKSTIARILCSKWNITFTLFNAANDNKKTLEKYLEFSSVIIIDEIHRMNKDKQDILLSIIEKKRTTIIATTTENPYFTIVPALRSRMRILELLPLNANDIVDGLKNIIEKKIINLKINNDLINQIAFSSNGDFRYAINSLNLIKKLYSNKKITKEIVKNVLPSLKFFSDKKGDSHYDLLSAFHKSLRGSDIDASLYYLSLLIESGDIIGLERRMIMVMYEDIGLANPNLTLRITSSLDNAKKVGFPEASIILSYAVIELCKSPKSNSSYIAKNNALKLIQKGIYEIPKHLKDSHYKSAKKLNNGIGYKYPHDYGGYVKQQYLPNEIKNSKIFEPNKNDKI